MGFLRYANAVTTRSETNLGVWHQGVRVGEALGSNVRVASTPVPKNLLEQASDILSDSFSPANYLLSHATIVASVDTVEVPNWKSAAVPGANYGFTPNRKFANYRIDPKCDQWINNNHDCWDRPVLAMSYPTFIGGYNFVEHVQIPEQSKGRIIDAVARDIGDSLYVDILIATNRKHASLIQAIEQGRMSTLSMGCSIDFSICTQCGNVAVDEPGMCHHIRHGNKGSLFFDELGQRHRVAELCGHKTAGDTGGVRFVEASWVAIAAFQGAVLRNILVPEDLTPDNLKKAVDLLTSPPKSWSPESLHGFAKAATLVAAARTAQFDFGGPDEEEGDEGGEEKNFFGDLVDDVKDEVSRRTMNKIREEMEGKDSDEIESARKTTDQDDNLVRQAVLRVQAQQREFTGRVYRASINAVRHMAPSDVALINGVASINNAFGVPVPVEVYRAALRVGPTNRYPNVGTFVQACSNAMRRVPTESESRTLVRLGNMLAHWAAEQRSTS